MSSRRLPSLLICLAMTARVWAFTVTVRAVVPTETGQIGVNPVSDELGNPSDYAGPIGVDTQYLTMDGSTTKWKIGVNTEYLTEEIITTIVNDQPTETKIPVQIEVVTAAAAEAGIAAGDVTVLLSEGLRKGLGDAVSTASAACSAVKKGRAKRADFLSCMIDAGTRAAQGGGGGGVFDAVQAGTWETFALEVGERAPQILQAAFQVLATQAERNRFALFMGAVAVTGGVIGAEIAPKVPPKLKFGGGKVGNPDPTKSAGPSSTSSTCDPTKTPDENSPTCEDEDCVGQEQKCTVDPNKGCPCTEWTLDVVDGEYDKALGDEQQIALKQALANLPDSVPPSCFENTNGDGFDGKPVADPSAWCVCTSGSSQGIYPTIENSHCAYQTIPTETITINNLPAPTGPVTSCKWTTDPHVTSTTLAYCTCNDNKMHGEPVQTTKVENGQTVTECIPPDLQTANPAPASEPTCYPQADPPHNNPDNDQLIRLCNFNTKDTCLSQKTDLYCASGGGDGASPVRNNHYNGFFTKDENAPAECNNIFNNDHDKNPLSEAGANLCYPALDAIVKACPWTGGEVRNICGTFAMQSCPLGGRCKQGDPLHFCKTDPGNMYCLP